MLRLAGMIGWGGILAAMLTAGCHHKETRYVVVAGEAPAPAPAPVAVVETPPAPEVIPAEPAPAPPPAVVEAPPPAVAVAAPAPAVSVSFFYEKLGHYGHWVTVASYGRVWVPAGVAVGWQPYSLGHWVYTDAYGWTWASDETWGWATYHYGRWVFVEPQGWVWVPGTVWAPAWVVWRTGGGYVGWAPMPPEVVVAAPRPSVEINVSIGLNVVEHIHPHHWVFVREAHILEPVHAHIVAVNMNVKIIHETHHVTNIVESRGRIVNHSISVREVERVTGKPVRALHVREVETSNPGRLQVKNNEVVIPRLRSAAAPANSPAQPRSGAGNTAAQPTRTRVQAKPQASQTPTRGSATSTPRSGKVGDAVTRTQMHPSGNAAQNAGAANTQQGMRSGTRPSPTVDHYTQPFPAPVQPKVAPNPRRSRTASQEANAQAAGALRRAAKDTAGQTTSGSSSKDTSVAGTVRRPGTASDKAVHAQPETRVERGAVVRRAAPQPTPEPAKQPTPEPRRGVDVSKAASSAAGAAAEQGQSAGQQDRSRTVKRADSGRGDRRGEQDVERERGSSRRD